MDVLITGATKGIGLEVACRLAARGDSVIVTARDDSGPPPSRTSSAPARSSST